MQSAILAILCVFMTLGLTLAMYGGGSYGYSYVPYYPQQGGSGGLGEGGLLMLFGFFFIFFLLFNNSAFFNRTASSTPTINFLSG